MSSDRAIVPLVFDAPTVNAPGVSPGETIPPDRVKSICENPQWTVTMIDYDYFAAIAGLFGAAVGVATNKGMLPIP